MPTTEQKQRLEDLLRGFAEAPGNNDEIDALHCALHSMFDLLDRKSADNFFAEIEELKSNSKRWSVSADL